MATDDEVLALVTDVFAGPRPEHFTNYTHCCECAEHYAELLDVPIGTLTSRLARARAALAAQLGSALTEGR